MLWGTMRRRFLKPQTESKGENLSANRALALAIAHISEREAVFSEGDLFRVAADFGMGEVRPEALSAALDEAKRNGALQKPIIGEHHGLLTTPETSGSGARHHRL